MLLPYFCVIVITGICAYFIRTLNGINKRDASNYYDSLKEARQEHIRLTENNDSLLSRCLARNGFAPLGVEKPKPPVTPPPPTGLPGPYQARANAYNKFEQWKADNGHTDTVMPTHEEIDAMIREGAQQSTVTPEAPVNGT